VIRENAHKYGVSALCKCLGISRSTYYYEVKPAKDEDELDALIQNIFEQNRCIYGSRKIKSVLKRQGIIISTRRICRIMKHLGLKSAYTMRKYKNHSKKVNEASTPNLLNRNFHEHEAMAAVVSDLTYVRVGQKWQYICILLDLHNREIIGFSSGERKDAKLVRSAFASVKINLFNIQVFHTDRGSEFDNSLIDELLDVFQIKRSLSLKGCPYDNAVAESTFKMIKSVFVNRRIFQTSEQLQFELADYVHWFNCIRVHSTLGYLSPVEFRLSTFSFLYD